MTSEEKMVAEVLARAAGALPKAVRKALDDINRAEQQLLNDMKAFATGVTCALTELLIDWPDALETMRNVNLPPGAQDWAFYDLNYQRLLGLRRAKRALLDAIANTVTTKGAASGDPVSNFGNSHSVRVSRAPQRRGR